MRETVLITGGSGFIGTHLCKEFLDQGYRVRVLDLRAPEFSHGSMEYQKGDVQDPNDVRAAVEGVDGVIHLAALVSVELCQQHPIESYRTNVLGTCIIADAVRQERVRSKKALRLVFASSAAVYGNSGRDGIPLNEMDALPEPLSFYAAQKLASEILLKQYFTHYRLPSLSLRFFNVFGPGQNPSSPYSGVMTVFANRIRAKKELFLNGGGVQTRDFIYVTDVARACRQAFEAEESVLDGQAINIGSGTKISISELARWMTEMAKGFSVIQDAPARQGDVCHSLASIEKAERLLKWAPTKVLRSELVELLR